VTAAAVIAALLAASAPTPTPSAGSPSRVAEGRWGGLGIAIEVTASGATIELDCAHGTIDEPLLLDADGRFELPGKFVRERPGPVREDEEEKGESVRYSGRLEGDALTLRIQAPSAPRQMPPLTAILGRTPRLRKCG